MVEHSDDESEFSWDEEVTEPSTASSAAAERSLFWQFVGMEFSKEMVERALRENVHGDAEKILEALTSCNPPAASPSEAGPSKPDLFSPFVRMGFSEKMVDKAIRQNVDGDAEKILEALTSCNPPAASPSEAGPSKPDLFSPFVRMGFCEKMVDKAIRQNVDGDAEKILEALTSCNPPAASPSEAGPSEPDLFSPFVRMGFCEKMVDKAIRQNEKGDAGGVLETLLTYKVVAGDSSDHEETSVSYSTPSDSPEHSDSDDFVGEGFMLDLSEKAKKLLTLLDMGYAASEAYSAIDRCGVDASFLELADSICAAQMAEHKSHQVFSPMSTSGDEDCSTDLNRQKKRKQPEEKRKYNKRYDQLQRGQTKDFVMDDMPMCQIPKPMIGFGIPNETPRITERVLPEVATGRPYFYYENVALAPRGVWATISRFLYDIEPEFVDSKYFSAAARKRGYIHNLPIQNRFPIRPIPPRTIQEALPRVKRWWPFWDQREQLNCLQTRKASAKLTEKIRSALASYDDSVPLVEVQKMVLKQCKKWNLVWVGLNRVAPLEPNEIEILLGYPEDHTRGINMNERYRSLGNSFHVDAVAYHLSVLKEVFPNGITVLSLFSGIGGAEVALHKLGMHIKAIVSVEISESCRAVVRYWWEATKQRGIFVEIDDVQKLSDDGLEKLINEFGGFDLVIGGSPGNNLTGSNRHSRDGLEGKDSSLFFDYFRIVNLVRSIMGRRM